MNKKLKTLIYIPASKKFLKVSISILMSALILHLSLTPFLSKFNYTPFKVFAVEIIPSKTYKITYDLPHLSKGITAKQREKAENNLSKTFRIPLSSLKQNEYLSKPLVYITYIPFLKKYEGFVKIGNIISKFDKIKALQEGTPAQNTEASNSDSNNQSDILLTGYFTLNNILLRANIFIMNNGSVLRYSSMTIQDQNDNVLAMFTFGRNVSGNEKHNINTASASSFSQSYGNASFATRSFNVKYIYINDPYGSGITYYEPAARTDAMSVEPFPMGQAGQSVAVRIWAFQNRIAYAYKKIYENYGTAYVSVGVYKITDKFDLHYTANAMIGSAFPQPYHFNESVVQVNFSIGPLSISYPLYVSGTELKWNMANDPSYASSGFTNVATNTVETRSQWSYTTFDTNWNNSFQWKENDYSYSYRINPDSSFKGYFARVDFLNYAIFNHYFGDFYSSVYYSIEAGNGASYDWYYITVSNNLYDVRLDQ